MDRILIKFNKYQKLPDGYSVEFWESDEMYHWVFNDENYSIPFCTRWKAFRSAWNETKL